jgi:hypothetical protein
MVFARQCLVGFGFNSEYKDEGTYTAICFQEDGLIDEASVDVSVSPGTSITGAFSFNNEGIDTGLFSR